MEKRKVYEIPIEAKGSGPAGASGESAPADTAAAPPAEVPGEAPATENLETGDDDLAQALDHLRRLQAEFVNYRKRVDKERLESDAWSQGTLLQRLLPVADDVRRAVASVEGDGSAAARGLRMIGEKLERALAEAGLERMDVVGAPFDPERHEALATVPVKGERAGTVVQELEPGYVFKGRLLRPARVQVGVDGG
jgi:molecular chaperone GrpE